VLSRRSERWVGGVGVVAGLALFISLFLSWYEVDHVALTQRHGGFLLVFGAGPGNAWNSISSASYVLAACALLIAALVGVRLFAGLRVAALAGLGVAMVAVGVAGYRVLNPPTREVSLGTAAYFSRSAASASSRRAQPLQADGGAPSALGAALVAAGATGALVLGSRRRIVRPT
jgi:hypothetical protein